MKLLYRMRRLNQAQRLIVGIAASICVLVILAHNPISGYDISAYETIVHSLESCGEKDREDLRQSLISTYKEDSDLRKEAELAGGVAEVIERRLSHCYLVAPGYPIEILDPRTSETVSVLMPIWEWSSSSPLIHQFGSLATTVYIIFFVIFVAAIFVIFVFAPHTDSDTDDR